MPRFRDVRVLRLFKSLVAMVMPVVPSEDTVTCQVFSAEWRSIVDWSFNVNIVASMTRPLSNLERLNYILRLVHHNLSPLIMKQSVCLTQR
jgi:hypothetical protein